MNIENHEHLNDDYWFDYAFFYDRIANNKLNRLVEVGVWKGHSVIHLAKKMIELGHVAFKLFAVDTWEEYEAMSYITYYKDIYNIYNINVQLSGVRDNITDLKMSSRDASYLFADNTLDFVFIDAEHTFLSVLSDVLLWYPKVKPGAIIAGHDYGGEVEQAVNLLRDRQLFKNTLYVEGNIWWTIK